MAAVNPNDLSKFSGILEIRPAGSTGTWTRLPSVRGLTTTINDTNVVEVKADDTGTVYKATDRTASIELELLENANRDNLKLLFGGTSTDIAGTLVSGATQVVSSGSWDYNKFIKIENQNGDGSAITVNSVTGATDGALVADTDFYTGQNAAGEYGIFIIDSATVTTTAQDVTIDFDYTPNSSENLDLDLKTIELNNFEVRVTATENGSSRTRKTIISSATLNSEYSVTYQDVIEAGDITGSTLTFESNKGATYSYQNEIL